MMTATYPPSKPRSAGCRWAELEPVVVVVAIARTDGEPIPPRPDVSIVLDPWDVEADPADWPDDTENWLWVPTDDDDFELDPPPVNDDPNMFGGYQDFPREELS